MEIEETQLTRFMHIYAADQKSDLSRDEAVTKISDFLDFMAILLKPIPNEDYSFLRQLQS